MWQNEVSYLDLSNNTKLERLVILNNRFKSLDISNVKKMTDQFIIQDNPGENGKFVITVPFDETGQPINVPEQTEWRYSGTDIFVEFVRAN